MKRFIVSAAALVLAAVLIVAGVLRGEPKRLCDNAAMICLECIGIG